MLDSQERKGPLFVHKYCMAVAAAGVAETVLYPLDLVKTRMQLSTTPKTMGMLTIAHRVIINEGIFHLWTGISAQFLRLTFYSGIRMAVYEKLRDDVFLKDPDGSYPLHKAMVTSLIAGGLAQLSGTPLDLVKVQVQTGRCRNPPEKINAYQAFTRIYKDAGFAGIWRGWRTNVPRGAILNLGELSAYDVSKRFLLKNTGLRDGVGLHAICSIFAGLIATIMVTPLDVVNTRIMMQPTKNGIGLYYRDSIHCLQKTVRNEGVVSLYRGFFPLWMRLGPWSLMFWVTFEGLRKKFGVEGF